MEKDMLIARTEKLVIFCMLVLGIFTSGCFKSIPSKKIIYQNDFETNDTRHIEIWSPAGRIDSSKVISYNGSRVLGRFNNNLVSIKCDTLPEHNTLKIEFDLYIHDQWDGDYLRPGSGGVPDVWNMTIDGYTIYQTTFSNGIYHQSFPDNYNGYSQNPAHSNAWELLPGVCANAGKPDGTAHYKIEYITTHTGPLKLEFNDAVQPFNSLCLKSWSIDNLKITSFLYK
jgi:hypothetical protein